MHRERLLEWHWPDLPPERALAALHTTLYELRRGLEPGLSRGQPPGFLVTEGASYRLVLRPDDHIDAYDFLALLGRAERRDVKVDDRIADLETAVGLYEGEFLPQWPYAEWASEIRRELIRGFERALEALGRGLVEAGRPREAQAPLERLLALDPGREAACRALMSAHEDSGEPARALRRYHLLRAVLRRDGVEPGPETRALYSEILRRTDEASG